MCESESWLKSGFRAFWLDSDSDSELESKNPDSDSRKKRWIRIRVRIRDSRKIRWIQIHVDSDSRLLDSDLVSDLRCSDSHITDPDYNAPFIRWWGYYNLSTVFLILRALSLNSMFGGSRQGVFCLVGGKKKKNSLICWRKKKREQTSSKIYCSDHVFYYDDGAFTCYMTYNNH